jgi:tetratricopeptide (TPR) repeat protein
MHSKSDLKLEKQLILLLIIFVMSSSLNDLFSQNIPSKPSRQSSMEAFSKGNYDQAYKEFRVLLQTYSKDPLYRYYSGVCLVKLNRDPAEAESLLTQAIQSAAVIKTLPSDALFYLGRAQQMGGKFNEAIYSYDRYTKQVGKKIARENNVQDFVQQCNENKGKVAETDVKQAEIVVSEKKEVPQIQNQPLMKDTIPEAAKKESPVKKDLPPEYEKILDEALEYQIKADSLATLIAEQKKQLENLPAAEKSGLRVKISENETAAASFWKSADQKYIEAQSAKNPPQPGQPVLIKESINQTGNSQFNTKIKLPDNQYNNKTDNPTDTGKTAAPPLIKPVEIFSVFEVSKPVTDPGEKIKIDQEIPAGLIYRIQMAVFRNPVPLSFFKGITPVYGFKVAGTENTCYYAGMFRRLVDATKALSEVKSKGFKDAFVVSLSENKRVSSDRAAVMEKEWGKKPLSTISNSGSQITPDTIPPALVFRVQVIRTSKPVKDDVIEGIRKMAGTRGLDIQSFNDGNIAYLIGKFITFDSAAEYADLLVRNGYREATVVAWLGKKEVPIETARQLFEKMK